MVEYGFFLEWRGGIYERFSGLFTGDNKDDDDDEADRKLTEYNDEIQQSTQRATIADAKRNSGADLNRKWGWIGVIYSLCGGDITKTDTVVSKSLLECLVWLSYEKEMEIRK